MTLSFYSLILFLTFVYFEPQLLFPALGPTHAAFWLSCVSFIGAFLAGARPPRTAQNRLFIFLLLMGMLSLFFAPYPFAETNRDYLSHLLKATALYFLISMILTQRERLKKFFFILLGFAFTISTTTLLTVRAGIEGLRGGDLYRMTNYFGGIGSDSNQFGLFMLTFLPLPLAFLEGERSLLKKAFYLTMALSFLLCITRTRSRGAFIGLLFVLLMILWEYRRKFGFILLVLVLLSYTFLHTHHRYWDRIETIRSENTLLTESSAQNRYYQYLDALELLWKNPLKGVGLGNFIEARQELWAFRETVKNKFFVCHNAYLAMGAETGMIGLLLFTSIIFASLRDCFRSEVLLKQDEDLDLYYRIAKGVKTGFVGMAVAIFFLPEQFNLILYQWIALSVALKQLALKEPLPEASEEKGSPIHG